MCQLIADLDIEGLSYPARFGVALRLKRQMHGVVRDPPDTIRLLFELRNGIFDHDGLDAVFPKHLHQVTIERALVYCLIALLLFAL